LRRVAILAVLLAITPLVAFGPGERTAPTHWALIVGVSDYLHFADAEGGDLPGAEQDALAFRDVLVERWGVPEENVRMLLDREATRAAIEEGITGWLGGNARAGDHVVVFFAGHGSQIWDESGDEADGLDETLAPADVSPTTNGYDISDDTFGDWLEGIPTTNVVVVLDQSHSGAAAREVTPSSRARQLGRDVERLDRPEGVARTATAEVSDETGFDAGGAGVLRLAAAQPHQAAVEVLVPGEDGAEPFQGGAFTTALVRALWQAPADASYQDVIRNAAEALKRNRFQQEPHLSEGGSLGDLALLSVEGGAGGAAPASLPVRSVDGDRAELGGGQRLGLTRGSVFTTEDGATLVVESVSRRGSQALVVAGSVEAGASARLAGFRYPFGPLRVNTAALGSAADSALAEALGTHPMLQLVPDEEAVSHLLLRRGDQAVRIVGADGFLRETVAPGDAEVLPALLRQEAGAKRLADMKNPVQPFRVALRLEGGKTSFATGEAISFHVTSEEEGYLTLVDLGTDGTVVVLFPNRHQPTMRIEAGETVSFPTDDMDFELQAFPPAGRGMVRAFVTPEPLELVVEGEYAEGDERFAEALAQAVMASAGDVRGAVRLDSWATASLVYEVHHR